MKEYHVEGSIKKINAYLKKIGLECFCFDGSTAYLPFDCDVMLTETDGVSVQIERTHEAFECFVTKYNLADIAKLEAEL